MKKSKVVKKVKSKSSALPKRIKKYDDGGIQGLKKNPEYEAKMPAGITMPKGDMPYGTGMEMKLKSEAVPANKVLKKIEMPEGSLPVTPTAPAKSATAPKAKLLPGGFTSEAQKAAYIKNVKARMAKGATIDQLVKDKVGTKAGLEGLGLKDTPAKQNKTKKAEPNKSTSPAKLLAAFKKQAVASKLPLSSKVPLKNGKMTSEDKKRLGKQQASYGKHLKQSYIRKKNDLDREKAWKQLEENFEETRIRPTDLIPGFRMVKQGQKIIKVAKVADKILPTAKKFLGSSSGKKLIGEGIKNVVKTGSKALKPDKIIKPTTKALNSGQKMLGRTINVSGRTVSSGSQKALNSGQKLLQQGQTKLNPGQIKLNQGQKLLQQGSKASKSTAAKVNQVAKNRSLTRNTRNAKVEAGIKTNNKVARSMRLKDETANLVKKGTQKVKTSVKNSKIKNAKPKPGDQLKLNLRGGGKK